MLSDVEMGVYRKIKDRLMQENGKPTVNDGLYLVDLVQRLLQTKPTEYAFPAWAALVNDMNPSAYAMRYDRRIPRELECLLPPRGSSPVYEMEISCDICNAELWARPYVRVIEPQQPETWTRLMGATLTMTVDGEILIDRFPLSDFLVGPDGYGVARKPFSFTGILATVMGTQSPVFRGCRIQLQGETPGPGAMIPTGGTHPNGWEADGAVEYGAFLVNRSRVDIGIDGIAPSRTTPEMPITVAIGGVAAMYSTKNREFQRKQDWSPRDGDQG